MSGGTYTLVVERRESATIRVGARGPLDFPAGWYAYTGSALGPGGFARVERHRAVADGRNDARHWHIDYLLGAPGTSVETVVTSPGVDAECAVARTVEAQPVPRFGASDCHCETHLCYDRQRDRLLAAVARAHDGVRS